MIFAGAALLALLLLAATLNALRFDPGENVALYQLAPNVTDPGASTDLERIVMIVIRVMMILFWLILPAAVVLLIIDKEMRKRFLRDLMVFTPVFILLYMLSRRQFQEGATEALGIPAIDLGSIEQMAPEPAAPLPTYQPPADWVTGLVSILLAVGIAAVIAAVGWAIYRRSRKKAAPLQAIEQEAQAAIDAIEAGGDLSEAIMRCYFQMIEALKQYRNIHRDQDVTPHEFEAHLMSRGLPREPVHQLTALFEQVRYGGVRPGRADERGAIASLRAIVAACQRETSGSRREGE